MSSFTPGPWLIERRRTSIISIGPIAAEEYAGASWLEVSEEDARLIAAAPDLLEALQSIRRRFVACISLGLSAAEAYDSFYQEIVDEAITKATGGAA